MWSFSALQYYLHVALPKCSLLVLKVLPVSISAHPLIQEVMEGRDIPVQVLPLPLPPRASLPGCSPLRMLSCPPSRSIALVVASPFTWDGNSCLELAVTQSDSVNERFVLNQTGVSCLQE